MNDWCLVLGNSLYLVSLAVPTYECLHDFADHGALPMYLDLIGPQFVLALRQCLGGDWEERFEYHFLALFDMIVYGMKVGWTLQRADEQTKESNSWHSLVVFGNILKSMDPFGRPGCYV